MVISRERWAALLTYCKLEEYADDECVQTELRTFYAAAVGYMAGAGVRQPPPGTPREAQYDLCVNVMVLDSWEHRDMKESGNQAAENMAFRRMLNQLKRIEGVVSKVDITPQEKVIQG